METCPHCGAPRVDGLECPRCGVIYAKAFARAAPPEAPPAPLIDEESTEDRQELRLRRLAIPVALVASIVLEQSKALLSLVKIADTMYLHELGHMCTDWMGGFVAVPVPWFTYRSETRGPVWALIVLTMIVALGTFAWKARRWPLLLLAGSLLSFQVLETVILTQKHAHALGIFGGHAGAMINGTLLMLSIYAPENSWIRRGDGLRWGFLGLGAAAYVDEVHRWWLARSDVDAIFFGTENGQPSDATQLVDRYGWTVQQLVDRNLMVAGACLIVLVVGYVLGIRAERGRRQE